MFVTGIILNVILFVTGAPLLVAFAIGGAFIALMAYGMPPQVIATFAVHSITSYTFLAIPLFVLMGEIFQAAGAARPLINAMAVIFGRLPGGMGVVLIASCAFFSALCGSGDATIASIGVIMVPTMLAMGYDKGTTSGALAAAGTLGNLIPPSIFFILYGGLLEVNIVTLFAAGMIPGIITAVMLALTFIFLARRKRFPALPPLSRKEIIDTFIKAAPALVMPVIILGGIYGGVFTPTEAASVACVYSAFLGFVVYRKLTLKSLWQGTSKAAMMIGNIYLMILGVTLLSKTIALTGWPQGLATWVTMSNTSPVVFLLLAALLMVILGVFMEAICMMLLTVPILFPAAMALGISPIHLGVIVCLAMLVGGCTPPMAAAIYVASIVTKVPAHVIAKAITPFTITLIMALLIVLFFPEVSLTIPKLMGLSVY